MTRRWTFPLLTLLGLLPGALQAAIETELRPNPVLPGEVFELRITQSPAGDSEPVLGPLPEGLRELQRQQSQSVQIYNGQSRTSRTWSIALVARQPGVYTLMPQPLDGEPVPPLSLTVKAPDPQAQQQPEVFARFSASTEQSWVGAEISLHLQVYVAGELDSGSLPDPTVDGLLIEKVQESNDGEELIGNTRYRVLDRRYVAFAEQAGQVIVPGPVFIGQLVDRSRRSRFPSFSLPTRRVQTVAPDLVLDILPAVPNSQGAWLPARQVTLEDALELPPGGAEVGQALTRKITLRVDGQLHTQLPELNWPQPARTQAQTYAEQGQSRTVAQGDGVSSEQLQRFVHIPQGGPLELPGMRLPWFNVRTGRWEEASLPPRRLDLPDAPPLNTLPSTAPTAELSPQDSTPPAAPSHLDANSLDSLRLWRALALGAVAGWAITVLGWVFLGRKSPTQLRPVAEQTRKTSATAARKALLSALQSAEALRVEQALLRWGEELSLLPAEGSPSARGLLALAEALEPGPLRNSVQALSAHRYAQGSWSAAEMAQAVRQWKPPQAQPQAKAASALPPLYPGD